jgi:hypothetical protein
MKVGDLVKSAKGNLAIVHKIHTPQVSNDLLVDGYIDVVFFSTGRLIQHRPKMYFRVVSSS